MFFKKFIPCICGRRLVIIYSPWNPWHAEPDYIYCANIVEKTRLSAHINKKPIKIQ